MLKGLIFDMDGLLFDSERVVQRSWQIVGEQMGIPDFGEIIYHTIGFNRQRRSIFFKERFGESFDEEFFARKTRQCFYDIVEKEGLGIKKGAKEILKWGKEEGLAIGIATSSSKDYAMRLLTTARIASYFDGGVFGNQVTCSKPHPEIYQKAAKAIGILPEEAVAFEDAPSGVEAANRARIPVIMVPDLVMPTNKEREVILYEGKDLLDAMAFLQEKYHMAP